MADNNNQDNARQNLDESLRYFRPYLRAGRLPHLMRLNLLHRIREMRARNQFPRNEEERRQVIRQVEAMRREDLIARAPRAGAAAQLQPMQIVPQPPPRPQLIGLQHLALGALQQQPALPPPPPPPAHPPLIGIQHLALGALQQQPALPPPPPPPAHPPLRIFQLEFQDPMPLPAAVVGGPNGGENVILEDNSPPPNVAEPCEVLQIECEISKELSDCVFENDMLREIILNFVINSHGKVSRPNVKNCRLVRKNWLGTVVDSMQKYSLPLFNLTLDNFQFLRENNVPTKPLRQFVSAMTSPSRILDLIPPFRLKLLPDFFRNENHTDLSNCLVSCGEALIDFELLFPVNSSMTFAFPAFSLPQLQKLAVQISDQKLNNTSDVIYNNGHSVYPLQIILRETVDLQEITFKYTTSEHFMPFGFEYLVLPETVTRLYLDCPVKNSNLELLIKNKLPNLKSLRLFATSTPYSADTIFQILEKYRTTLHTLSLRGHRYHSRVLNPTLFKFPVMENLEVLIVTSQCWEFEDDLNNLETQLPKMSELRMLNTRDSMFTKWTENSKFEAVRKLFISLIDVDAHVYHHNQVEVPMTITLERMQSLHLAFPNVVNLEMTLWGPHCCGLKYLLMEMRSLEKLAITVKGTEGDQLHPGHWDSVLIGVPMDMVISLRSNPDFLRRMDLKDDVNFPYMRNLTALKSLALVDSISTSVPGDPLISDLSFHFAFLKMKNLNDLLLHGRFSPSTRMAERWKQEKGTEIRGFGN